MREGPPSAARVARDLWAAAVRRAELTTIRAVLIPQAASQPVNAASATFERIPALMCTTISCPSRCLLPPGAARSSSRYRSGISTVPAASGRCSAIRHGPSRSHWFTTERRA
jgi:hypothetical protein